MAVHAVCHSVGVVLDKMYYPLELSFVDATGYEQHFHIQSPVPYTFSKKYYPHSRPDAIMTVDNATPYHEVLQFLHDRFLYLKKFISTLTFGCKGGSNQANVLRDAQIPSWVNLDEFKVPSLPKLSAMYNVNGDCPWHRQIFKCSRIAVQLIQRYLLEQQLILPLSQNQLVSEVHHISSVGDVGGNNSGTRFPQMIQMDQSQ